MIEYKFLNKKSLFDYVHSPQFGSGKDIPITKHRALSQLNNPHLEEDDIIMILAFETNVLVGYLGILPDVIYGNDQNPNRVGWLSCLWVSPNSRGQGISLELINHALMFWNNNILSADYVPFTKNIYDKTNSFESEPFTKIGLRMYIKADLATILPPKKIVFSKIKPLLKLMDLGMNSILNLRLRFYQKNIADLTFEYPTQVDDEMEILIRAAHDKKQFRRSKAELNWILNNPWILSSNQKSALDNKYHFSSTSKSFEFKMVKVRNLDKELVAILIFSLNNRSLKLPYLFHINNLEIAVRTINFYIQEWDINTFTTFHTDLSNKIKISKNPSIFTKKIKRNYMISKALSDIINRNESTFQDGDGDCVFT